MWQRRRRSQNNIGTTEGDRTNGWFCVRASDGELGWVGKCGRRADGNKEGRSHGSIALFYPKQHKMVTQYKADSLLITLTRWAAT